MRGHEIQTNLFSVVTGLISSTKISIENFKLVEEDAVDNFSFAMLGSDLRESKE